MISCTYDTQLL